MAKNRNPFVPEPAPVSADAAQRIVDLELENAQLKAENAELRAEAERTWRMHWVDDANGKRHVVKAPSADRAVAQIGEGARFRGYPI